MERSKAFGILPYMFIFFYKHSVWYITKNKALFYHDLCFYKFVLKMNKRENKVVGTGKWVKEKLKTVFLSNLTRNRKEMGEGCSRENSKGSHLTGRVVLLSLDPPAKLSAPAALSI